MNSGTRIGKMDSATGGVIVSDSKEHIYLVAIRNLYRRFTYKSFITFD
ncbi:MAG: hypothetical protein ACFFFT_03775 [Candidatus Thorarchaeota archaeon]